MDRTSVENRLTYIHDGMMQDPFMKIRRTDQAFLWIMHVEEPVVADLAALIFQLPLQTL